ncbi:unnamed protein product [marine sediment metagenome]|uniref:Uncharacterized protein n=1 Tax=marine sediment metagenome TaxID=412755 RepID=X1F8G8_9ZZZZ
MMTMKVMSVQESLTRAKTAFRIGEYELAARLLSGILEKKPDIPHVQNFLGTVYEKLDDYGRTIQCFKKAIELKKGTRLSART